MRKQLFLLLQVFACFALAGQPGQSSFVRYTTDQGLSNDFIKDVLKDQQGFLWVATINGLNRFDSHSFRHFFYSADQPNGLPDNFVKNLTLAPDGSIWTSGNKGICRIDPVSLVFERFILPENRDSLENDKTGKVVFDQQGFGWVSSEKALYKFDPLSGSITSYPIDLPYAGYYCTYLDKHERIWLIEGALVSYFDIPTGQLKKLPTETPGNPLAGSAPLCVAEDHCGNLWMTTWFKGLALYDPILDSLVDFPDNHQLTTAILPETSASGESGIWLGGGHSGLFYYYPEKQEDIQFLSDPRDIYTHNNYMVTSFFKDETDGSIWIGTEAGLEHYALTSLRFNRVVLPVDNRFGQFSLMSGAILDNTDPSGNTYYIGMWGSGLFRWNRKQNTFEHFHEKNSGLPDNGVLSSLQDRQGNIWIGAYGVIRFNPRKQEWRHWECIPERIQKRCNIQCCPS